MSEVTPEYVTIECDESPARLARRMRRVAGSSIMELLKLTAGRNLISFASGLPDPSHFPTTALAEIADDVLRQDGRAALQYGAAEGYAPLRDLIAEMLRGRGISHATAEHILITNGSEQALDLTTRALLDPGDTVLVELPTYTAAIQTFDSCEAQYLTVPIDAEGMDTEQASRLMREQLPRAVFALPNFQNPSGVTMSLERRIVLAETAAATGTALLEDDAYHDLRYDGEPLPPLTALSHNPLAVYTGTFSKTVAPGLRVGYLCAEPALVERLTQLKQISDLHTGSLTQRMVYEFCVRGQLEPHLDALREVYSARRNTLLAAIAAEPGLFTHWTQPRGGMFVLAWLPEPIDAAALLPAVIDAGVVYVPAAAFYADLPDRQAIRLNFVSSDPITIRRGMHILADIVRGL